MVISPSSSVPSDPETVSANRAGQLTDRQRRILKPPSVLGTQIVLVVSLVIIALGAYFFLAALLAGRVETQEGIVNHHYESVDEVVVYYYTVNNKKFRVSMQGYNALVAGQTYRLYYMRGGQLLSIEPQHL